MTTHTPIHDDAQMALEAALSGETPERIAESVCARNIDGAWEHVEHMRSQHDDAHLRHTSEVLGCAFGIRSDRETR